MKNALAIAALFLLSLSLTGGRQTSKASVEDQVKKQEQNWAEAVVREGALPTRLKIGRT